MTIFNEVDSISYERKPFGSLCVTNFFLYEGDLYMKISDTRAYGFVECDIIEWKHKDVLDCVVIDVIEYKRIPNLKDY